MDKSWRVLLLQSLDCSVINACVYILNTGRFRSITVSPFFVFRWTDIKICIYICYAFSLYCVHTYIHSTCVWMCVLTSEYAVVMCSYRPWWWWIVSSRSCSSEGSSPSPHALHHGSTLPMYCGRPTPYKHCITQTHSTYAYHIIIMQTLCNTHVITYTCSVLMHTMLCHSSLIYLLSNLRCLLLNLSCLCYCTFIRQSILQCILMHTIW